jgi:hypothetical protein
MTDDFERTEGWESLGDSDTVQEGDIVKDVGNGEYRKVCEGSFDALLIGLTAGHCRSSIDSINDLLRPVR